MTVTACPASTKASTTCDPMKPLPPVTTTLAMIGTPCSSTDDVFQCVQNLAGLSFVHSRKDRKTQVPGAVVFRRRKRTGRVRFEHRLLVQRFLIHLAGQRDSVLVAQQRLEGPPI